jgi:hypothetical protein
MRYNGTTLRQALDVGIYRRNSEEDLYPVDF